LPIFVRGLRGILRWPAARVARLALLAVVAAAALRGAWTGTTPLVLLAGVAMFLAALDGVEPLAQEVDHPSRRDASPLDRGEIHLRHVPVCVLVMVLVGGATAGLAAVPGPGQVPGSVAAALAVPLALGGVSGALASVLAATMSMSETWAVAPVEAQGMRVAFRAGWPLVLATVGALPIVAARIAVDDGNPGPAAALSAAAGAIGLFSLVVGWVRVRDDVAAWWRNQMEAVNPAKRSEPDG
jgi:hypothetical protein